MLEANTDRSYFMIGAVIVAALLISLAIWMFRAPDPDVAGDQGGFLRAAITENLEDITDNANTIVDDIGFND